MQVVLLSKNLMAQKSHQINIMCGRYDFPKNPPKMFFFPHITSCHDVNARTHGEWCVQLWAPINLFKLKKSLYGHQPLFRFSSQRCFWTKNNPKNSKFVYKTFSTQEVDQENLPEYNFYPIASFWSVYIKWT